MFVIPLHMKAFTAVTSGDWSSAATWGGIAPGSTVTNQDIIIPSGITVNLDMDVTFSGLLNSFTVDGTLNSTGTNWISIGQGAFSGTGTVDIERLEFSGLLTSTAFSGTMTLGTLRNDGAPIVLSATVSIDDSLLLDAGALTLGSGSNLSMMAGSDIRVDNGSLTTTGGVFSTGNAYNVWYVGVSKTSGLELNSTMLQNLYINLDDNTQTVTMGANNLTVNGTLYVYAGFFSINGNHLTLAGDLSMAAGTRLVSTAASDMTIQGSGSMMSGLWFETGSSISDLNIDRSGNGSVMLMGNLDIVGSLNLHDGDFSLESGSNLTMGAGSMIRVEDGAMALNGGTFTGTAAYNVEYIGSANTTTGEELSGSGLNNVTVNMSSGSSTVMMDSDVIIGGMLDLENGYFDLNGNDLTLNGSLDQNSTTWFVGDNASELELNLSALSNDTLWFNQDNNLDRLAIDLGAGNTITLASSLTLHDELDMVNGRLQLLNSDLTLASNASLNGYSDNDYIVTSGSGRLVMHIAVSSPYTTFPVGTMSGYSPAYVQQTSSGTAGNFMVRAMDGVYTQGTTGFNAASTESLVDRTWVIHAGTGVNVNMNLKLGWKASDEVNGFNRNQAYVAHYAGNMWDSYLAGSASNGANNTYELTRTAMTSTGPYAVVDTSVVLGLEAPAAFTGVNMYPNPATDFVTVEMENATNEMLVYQLCDVTGKLVMSTQSTDKINRFDLSSLERGCYFLKVSNAEGTQVITRRVIKS